MEKTKALVGALVLMLLGLAGSDLVLDLVEDTDSCPCDGRHSDDGDGSANNLLNVFVHDMNPFRGEWVSL